MQNEQIQITKYRLLCYKTNSKTINDLIQTQKANNNNINTLKTVKIMNSDKLFSIQGIHHFTSVQILNLNCNRIKNILPISKICNIKQLSVSSNQIQSIQGIQSCVKLEKLNFSNNLIKNLGPLSQMRSNGNSCLSQVDFCNNQIQDQNQIQNLKGYINLKNLLFTKKNATNPVCIKRKVQYFQAINKYIINGCGAGVKIDDKQAQKFIRQLNTLTNKNSHKNQQQSIQRQENTNSQNYQHSGYQDRSEYFAESEKYFIRKQPTAYKYPSGMKSYGDNISRKRSSAYGLELQSIIQHKDQVLEDLKMKIHEQQVQNSQQYKDLIKKQAELERVYGQLSQLGKQIDNKQSKLSQAHKRLQKLLQSVSQANKSIQHKNSEIESLNKKNNDLRIQNAQYKALSKNYEKRMSDLHQKAFDTAQQRAIRSQELKRQNKELYQQNLAMASDINSLKQRNRQLTDLLRQWDYKYQTKVNQIYKDCEQQKQHILHQTQKKISLQNATHEQQLNSLSANLNDQLKSMENQYQKALDEALNKYKIMKAEIDERKEDQKQLKMMKKQLNNKQDLIGDLQSALVALKREYQNLLKDKDRLNKQIHAMRMHRQDQQRRISQQLSRVSYEKNSLQRALIDAKENNTTLQMQLQRFSDKQRQIMELQTKVQDLQTKITTQQHMLDDKNDTIQDLKAEIDVIRQQLENKNNQERQGKYNQLKSKYDRVKRQKNQLLEANSVLQQQKQLVEQQKQAQQAQLQQNRNALQQIDNELKQFQGIIKQQQQQINGKDNKISNLISALEQCQSQLKIKIKQIEQYARQCQRLQIQLRRVKEHWDRNQRQIQRKHKQKIEQLELQRKQQQEQMARKLKKNIQAMTNNLFKIQT